VRRIAVLGNAAGGKSTLSLRLSERLGVPYYSVDKALWLPGWRTRADSDFARLHEAWLLEPGWVIDGWGDMAFIEERIALADAVVLVQHPLWRHCLWALKRQCWGILCDRSHGPDGCPLLRRTWQLVKAMRWIHLYGMPELEKRIEARCRSEAVYHVGSRRQLEAVARALAPP
jgi:adenylate kinase family enzyme